MAHRSPTRPRERRSYRRRLNEIVRGLDRVQRGEFEQMVREQRYTVDELQSWLNVRGVSVSRSTMHRHAMSVRMLPIDLLREAAALIVGDRSLQRKVIRHADRL